MQKPELKISTGCQIVECLLAVNLHPREPIAEFRERNKILQNIVTGKVFSVSMCLFCQFNALSVVFLKPMGCVKLGVISVYVNLQYRN